MPLHYSLSHHLPNVFLDGEIWFGRGMFSLAGMLFASSTCIVSWHALRYLYILALSLLKTIIKIIELNQYIHLIYLFIYLFLECYFLILPMTSYNESFLKSGTSIFSTGSRTIIHFLYLYSFSHLSLSLFFVIQVHIYFNIEKIVAPRILCKGSAHMNTFVEEIVEYGGEGVIVRKVGSHYLHGRNTSLIKLKVLLSLLCFFSRPSFSIVILFPVFIYRFLLFCLSFLIILFSYPKSPLIDFFFFFFLDRLC